MGLGLGGSGGGSKLRATSRSVSAGSTGVITTLAHKLSSVSTFSLLAGSNANLSISSAGAISATAAIANGVSQVANVREVDGPLALEYPVTVTGFAVTLGTLTLSGSLQVGVATSGTIIGATAGSSIAMNIPGITVNSAARTYSGTPTTAATVSTGLVETLAGAVGSPKSSPLTVAAGLAALGPATASFSAGAASGTVITAITGLSAGETLASVIPNDGRLAVSSTNLVVGLSASTAGSIAATVTTSDGRTLAVAVTVNAVSSLPAFTFATETNTLVAAKTAAGATPNSRRQYSLDRMIKRLKSDGVYSKLTGLWLHGDTAAASRINMVNPGVKDQTVSGSPQWVPAGQSIVGSISTTTLTVVSTTMPIFVGMMLNGGGTSGGQYINGLGTGTGGPGTYTVALSQTLAQTTIPIAPGWNFPTISDFLDTGIAANTVAQDDHSMGYFTRSQAGTAASFDMGSQATGSSLYIKKASSTAAMACGSSGATASPAVATNSWDGLGLYALSRTDSAGYEVFHGGLDVGRVTGASVAATGATTITVGKVNGQSTICKATIYGSFVGVGLTATEMAKLHAAVQTYLDTVEYGDLEIYEAGYAPAAPAKFDVVIYGSTLAGCLAAHRLKQLGASVCIVGGWRDRNLGGMSGNGLTYMDWDNWSKLGGIAWDVVQAARLMDSTQLDHAGNGIMTTQPKNLRSALRGRLDGARTGGLTVPIYWSDGVASATKTGTTVTSMTTVDGRTFTADYFLDTTEELDLAYVAGCTTTIGREASGSGWESLNGYCGIGTSTYKNTVQIDGGGPTLPIANAYNTPGDSSSGLIYGVEPMPSLTAGQADSSIMAYTFRMTWNTNQARRIPWGNVAPAGYSAAKYELMGRYMAFYPTMSIASIMKPSGTTSTATDTNNNNGISTNLINSGRDYTACESAGTRAQVYAAREVVWKDTESWCRGLIHWLVNSGDSRIPAGIVTSMNGYGWDWRNFLDPHPNDSLYWPGRMYIREHRRLVGDFVLNANDVTLTDGTSLRSVKTISNISYRFDSHPHRRFAEPTSATVFCEGGIALSQASVGGQANGADQVTPVPLEAYLPKSTDCTNLAVTFGVSATHVAMSAARMEMTTAQAGESLAYVIKNAFDNGKIALKDVDYPTVRTAILAAPTTYPPSLQQVN